MARKLSFALALSVCALFATAQSNDDWTEMMHDPNAKFEETQAKAEAWFKNRSKGKGSGWKQYKRWEYYMESRVAEDGTQSLPQRTLEEYQKYLEAHPEMGSNKRSSTSGDWEQLGPITMPANGTGQPNGIGRTQCVAFHPTDANTLLVGAASGGIWRSTDYGVSWSDITNNLLRLGVSSIAYHPTNTDTIFIGTGDRDGGDSPGYGVWWSTDAGATWAARNTGMGNREVYEILQHPSNPNIMLASCQDRVYRTTNLGANWTATYTGGEDFKDLAFKPGDPNFVYAASNDFFRSTDNGQTWGQITNGVTTGHSRIAIAVTAANPNYVYLFCADNAAMNNILRSTNSGTSFTNRATSPNLCGYDVTGGTGSQAWYDLAAIGDPNDADHFFTAAINCWETFDGGATWSIVTHWVGSGGNPDVHADHHGLEFSPHTGDLFLVNDGGIHYTTDLGATWTEISSGMPIAQVYKIGQSQTVRDLVINGYQDNGTGIYSNGSWTTEIGGDGMECIIDQNDESVMYGALYYGDIRRSNNGGATFGRISGGVTENGAWVTPYKLHPTDTDTMFAGYRDVWRSYNCRSAATGSVAWTKISAFGGTSTVRDLAIAPSNPNVIYVSRSGSNNFYRTNNALAASPTWTNLDAGLPGSSYPRDIEIDPNDPTHVFIAYGNDIYESVNSGASWTNIAGTLPGLPLNTIVIDTASTIGGMYVGMDVGVYYKDNTLPDWVPFMTGLPRLEILELEIYYDSECRGNDMLRAATYGRGLWESDLRDPGGLAPLACFRGTPLQTCTGVTVTMEDMSAYTPTSWAWTISPGTFSYVNSTSAASQNPQIQFNAVGLYTITLNATNGSGSDMDTKTSYINVNSSGTALPVSEDWETAALCGVTSNCGAGTCTLVNGWENPTNGVDDDIDWRVDEGGTPSSGTGPSVDFAPGTATGNYIYTEASSCSGRMAILLSPCLDLRTAVSPEITFAYHMNGGSMGELHLDIFSGGSWVLDVMPMISGSQGTAWLTRTVNLSAYAGQVVNLRFRGITGGGFASDIALDDINIVDNAPLSESDLIFAGAYKPQRGNLLNWELLSENTPKSFILDKELPSGDFEILTEVAANSENVYEFLDKSLRAGTNTYRLRTRQYDGTVSEGKIVEIFNEFDGESMSVYPNPADQLLNIEIQTTASDLQQIKIMDLTGRVILERSMQMEPGINQTTFDLSQLKGGMYLVKYKNQSLKVLKMD